jgi:hypothetical protein
MLTCSNALRRVQNPGFSLVTREGVMPWARPACSQRSSAMSSSLGLGSASSTTRKSAPLWLTEFTSGRPRAMGFARHGSVSPPARLALRRGELGIDWHTL